MKARTRWACGGARLPQRFRPMANRATNAAREATGGSPPRSASTPYIVLVGLDLSEPGGRAWRFAFEMAALRGPESEVHAVIVGARAMAPRIRDLATPGVSTSAQRAEEEEDGERVAPLKVLQHRSVGGEARLMAMHFRTGRPERAMVQLARELGADVIVVATEPTTRWQRLLGGSTADKIARMAPCPVVVVRPKTDANDPGVSEYGIAEEK
ncbi:Universal stress protein family protein [Minicystis rosea]|nr:Universal stress protein family protein [Minicystis rosea]